LTSFGKVSILSSWTGLLQTIFMPPPETDAIMDIFVSGPSVSADKR
jgi:hypothetical protein